MGIIRGKANILKRLPDKVHFNVVRKIPAVTTIECFVLHTVIINIILEFMIYIINLVRFYCLHAILYTMTY